MVKLSDSFRSIQPFSALLLGDFLLDLYTTGRVRRISPEAPVQVLEVLKQESRAGGAGNAALNLCALGGQTIAVGRIGNDPEGIELQKELSQRGVDTSSMLLEPRYRTPVKNRLIAESQQLLRVDHEKIAPLDPTLESAVIETLQRLIPTVKVVAISDYGKGFLTPLILQTAIQTARASNVPIIIDPKGIDFAKYSGATMIKPNLSEAIAAAKLPPTASLDEIAAAILKIAQVELLLITRSEAGMSIFERTGARFDFPVRSKEVKDVTGAGDTVLATICLAFASGLDIHAAAQLANIAAGISIERLGCVQVTLPEIAHRLLEFDAGSKVFDERHTYALSQVLKNRPTNLLLLEPTQSMSPALFRSIKSLSQQDKELIALAQGRRPQDDFVELLAHLSEIDFIILQRENLPDFHPAEIYTLENDELRRLGEGKEILAALMAQV